MFFGVDCFLEIISDIRISCLWKQSSDNCSKNKKKTQFVIFDEVRSTPLLPELTSLFSGALFVLFWLSVFVLPSTESFC